ncbi:ABC transporter ATP-binding protein [Rariglobus hedericola]|uniref:ABC transporter ATP-binding protein n=1 Tax=Rariglobus hedericola TaxID=2597822 RepID=A0A556QKA8_9BACT|nr:ABC transporter ATP-binding protein [Rariglobus hedericola]TSJ77080.1 ABC transporter ATP-binding protein [Rariglobus hedericola]
MNALTLKNVSVAGRLTDVSLELPGGALVGLVGPNGSGKSTLLQAAAGLLPMSAGEVSWGEVKVEKVAIMERARRLAWVPQEARFEFGFSVRAVVQQGRYAHGDDDTGVEAALTRFDLMGLAERPVNQLSGGERQRVMLARALVTGAKLQLWDEPLASLDPRHGLEVLMLANELKEVGTTVVMSLHDLRVAHCLDLVVVLSGRKVRAVGKPREVLTPELLREVFGVTARMGETLILELS